MKNYIERKPPGDLSRDNLDNALAHLKIEHRWIDAASYERGLLTATLRIPPWPLSPAPPPSIGMPQAAVVADQLVRTAIYAALNSGDDALGQRLRKQIASDGGGKAGGYLDLRLTIGLADDVPVGGALDASVNVKHNKTVKDYVYVAVTGSIRDGAIAFNGDVAIGGPRFIAGSAGR